MDVSLLVTGGTVLTMVPGETPLEDGAVAVAGQEIAAVGTTEHLRRQYPGTPELDARGGLIAPGFVNTHTHLAMVLLRGLADDMRLKAWLENHIWPAERAVMNSEAVGLGTRWAAVESLLGGVTCVCDMYFHAETVAEALAEVGLRGVVPESTADFPTPACASPEESLERSRELLQRFQDHPLVVPAVAPHAPYTVSAPNLVRAAELAEEYDAPLLIHLAETRWEVETLAQEKGVSPVAYLADLGVLSERTVAAHCVHVTDIDLAILAELEVGVASNPVSNLKLASGVAPVPDMLRHGLKLGFGTDGAASNNTLDLLRDAQLAALLYKGVSGDPSCLPARVLCELLTIRAAAVLGLDRLIGTLEPGKRADLQCLSMEPPHTVPAFDPYSHLAYAARSSDVRHVLVDGKLVLKDRSVLTADIPELRERVRSVTAPLATHVPKAVT